jgi:toxin ParE1/3/4
MALLDLIWETDARSQLGDALAYISKFNQAAAFRLKALIDERLEQTRSFPAVGRLGRVKGTRELIVHPNYVVIYQVTGTAIDVIRVLHARQRYP